MTGKATEPVASRTFAPALKLRSWVWHTIYFVSRVLIALRFAIRFSIPHDMPRGPVLLACKHVSAWDIPIGAYTARTALQKRKPYFQMGSFIGYPVFGRLVPVLQACGGFSVMRPKEVLRLRKSADHDRARIRDLMDVVNGTAEATRRAVLASGGVIVVFPEGTRDAEAVRPVRSLHEIESALALASSSVAGDVPSVVPATFSYGRPRWFRRPVQVEIGTPIPLTGTTAERVAEDIESAFRSRWRV